ncbi:MAG: hydroxymethylpyrimidine/phosphomethylpyrimidine kinase [Bacteroidetes bacterium]|nr:hydroxymethylpyrimidine/phosphomethylpyrimidine kinase [Bacteroidota bacterium]
MVHKRPDVLTIAGFDPCGGAGILADIKTFEANKVQGFGAVTGLTFQNESEFEGVTWINAGDIIRQADLLFKKYKITMVKIGMVESLDLLVKIIAHCTLHTAHCKIIWDPILKASAGFVIHNGFQYDKLIAVLKNIFLITPNMEEVKILAGENNEMKAAQKLSAYCNVFLKGGHSRKKPGTDYLFFKNGKITSFQPKKFTVTGKHGSGCVLSAAITANLALGRNLQRSCFEAKGYVTQFLASNKTLLGYHKI